MHLTSIFRIIFSRYVRFRPVSTLNFSARYFFFFSFVALFHHFYLRKGKSCGANAPWKLPLFLQFIAVESKIFMHFFFLFPPILFSDFSSFSAKKNTNCKINVTENSGKGFLGHKEESDSLPMRKCIFSKGVVAKEWIRSFCKKISTIFTYLYAAKCYYSCPHKSFFTILFFVVFACFACLFFIDNE